MYNRKLYKRMMSAVLAIAVLLCGMLVWSAAAEGSALKITADGQEISALTLYSYEKIELSADGVDGEVDYQWQIAHPEDANRWVNIYDATEQTISVTKALVQNVLDENDSTRLRCLATTTEGEVCSDAVTVTLVEEIAAANSGIMLLATVDDTDTDTDTDTDSGTASSEFVTITIKYERYANVLQADGKTFAEEYVGQAFTSYVATLKSGTNMPQTSVLCPTIVGYAPQLVKVTEGTTERTAESAEFSTVDGKCSVVIKERASVSENIVYHVEYHPADVDYEVRYFFQNIYDDLYLEDATLVERTLSTADNTVTYPVKAQGKTGTHPDTDFTEAKFDGFTSLYYEPETIAADGSTVFHVYYERNYCLMEFDCNGGYGTDTVYVRYGTYISVPIPVRAGWSFDGWDLVRSDETGFVHVEGADTLPATMPYYNTAYKAIWKTVETTYSVAYWIKDGDNNIFIGSRTENAVSDAKVSGTDDLASVNFCGEVEHAHVADCYTCKLLEHTHGMDQCTTSCSHTHTTSCISGLGSDGASPQDLAAIQAIGENEPQIGYIYEISIVGRDDATWSKVYMGTDSDGNHVWYAANTSMMYGDAIGIGSAGTYMATKYVADLSGYSCTHVHDESCSSCTIAEHTHSTSCCVCGAVEHTHHEHTIDCYIYANGGLSDADKAAIQAIGNSDPESGYVYEISVGTADRWYKLYVDGTWYTGTHTLMSGEQIGETGAIENCSCGSHTHYAKKYKAATICGFDGCSTDCSLSEHTHTDGCMPCGLTSHPHTDACKSEYAKYVIFDSYDTDITVEGDGSTVVNVYYKYKELFQIRFVYAKKEGDYYYVASDTYNGSFSASTGGAQWNYQIGSDESVLPEVVDPDGSTERKTVEIDGVTYYYISLTAAYGADIIDEWPDSNVGMAGGFYWGSWAAAPGSGYRLKYGDAHANIVGPYPTMSSDMIVDGGTLLTDVSGDNIYLAQYMIAWWADSGMNVTTHAYHNYLEVLSLPEGSTLVSDETGYLLEGVTYERYEYTNDGTTEIYIKNVSGNENDGKIYKLSTMTFTAAHNGDTRVDPVTFAGYTAINDSRDTANDLQSNSEKFINVDDAGNKTCIFCDDNCNYCNNYIYNLNVHSLKFWNHNDWLQEGGTGAAVAYGTSLQTYGNDVNAEYMASHYPDGLEPGAYEFAGWYTTALCLEGTEVNWATATMPDAELVVYACWKPVVHDVYFYYDYEFYTKAIAAGGTDKMNYYWQPTGANVDYPILVTHGDLLGTAYSAIPEAIEGYTFVGWFYIDDTGKKRFAPDTMEVKQELHLFAEWQSGFDTEYTVNYVLDSDGTEIATTTTGHLTAGKTKTFTAKVGSELLADYQEKSLFPTTNSHSILMVEDKTQNTYTFRYVEDDEVYYRVRYLDKITGLELHDDKVTTSTHAIVTEKFVPIENYVPDNYYIRKVLASDGKNGTADDITKYNNEIIFYYTPNEGYAPFVIEYYTPVLGATDTDLYDDDGIPMITLSDGTSNPYWKLEQSEIGTADVDTPVSRTIEPDKFTGFTYEQTTITTYKAQTTTNDEGEAVKEYVVDEVIATTEAEVSGTVTVGGLEIRIFYARKAYPYTIQYVEYGTGTVLEKTEYKDDKAEPYESTVDHTAKDSIEVGGVTYLFYETDEKPQTQTWTIRASETENVLTFYYQAKTVTVKYEEVCFTVDATDFGRVSLNQEAAATSAGLSGSNAIPGEGYYFVGWFSDAACTPESAVSGAWRYTPGVDNAADVQNDNGTKLKPGTLGDADEVTYYALFAPITADLTLKKELSDDSITTDNFIFHIVGQGKLSFVDLYVTINGAGSVTIKELPVGTYTITEETGWSWTYAVENADKDKEVKLSKQTVDGVETTTVIVDGTEATAVIFTNTPESVDWLHGEASEENQFTINKTSNET